VVVSAALDPVEPPAEDPGDPADPVEPVAVAALIPILITDLPDTGSTDAGVAPSDTASLADSADTALPHTGGWTDGWTDLLARSDALSDTANTDIWGADSGLPLPTGDVDVYTFEVGESGAYSVHYSGPSALVQSEVGGGAGAEVSFSAGAEPGSYVTIRVAGTGELGAYELAIVGEDPNDTRFLVGAYTGRSWDDRGLLAGGTTVPAFTLDEDFVWRGAYEITFLRTVDGTAEQDAENSIPLPEVNESPDQVTLWASNAARLGTRPAGSWFSSAPVRVEPTGYLRLKADPLLVNALAPEVVGQVQDELETNHPAFDDAGGLAPADPGTFQDLGALSGAGFVDYVNGVSDFAGDGAGADDDRYRFTAGAAFSLSASLEWEGGADIDWYLFDSAGELVDLGATSANPELGDGAALVSGETYYLVVVPYEGAANTSVPYTLRFEGQ
jgi:hypothetical protein